MKRLLPRIAALFCLSIACNLLAETAAVVPASKAKLRGDDRILQALDRFTFGPRPGDLNALRDMGLEKWFERQLHPDAFPNADLKLRLAQFPAMQETPQSLLYRLPSNAVIRQVIDGKIPIPQDPTLHAIYANEKSRIEARRLEKDKQTQPPTTMVPARMPPATEPPTMAPPAASMAGISGADPAPFDESRIAPLLALPAEQRLARLTALPQTEFDALRKALKPAQRAALIADLNPAQRELVAALENPQRVIASELEDQRLTRAIYSEAQLQEVMTDFWLNHFNVFLRKNDETPYYLVSYERDTIRPRALGKFEDLLEATAHSPAMMLYLDNASSMGPDSPAAERTKVREARNPGVKPKAEGLNENYARELMELHTLGVNGGYTQADVTQVARVLTGWTIDKPQRGGEFKFDASRHEPGEKTVLGKKFKENGEEEGRQLLHLLSTRPATARFLCRKLAVRFVSDDPPQKLVDRMTKAYLSSDGDIATVLKALFHAPEFWSAQTYRAKVKTPIEFVVSAARASNVGIDNMQPLANALRDMGMPLYGAVPPTGYKWTAATWVSTGALVNRMNFALSFAANRLPGVVASWAAPLDPNTTGSLPPSPATEEQRLESLLVAGGLGESTRAAVLQQFQAQSAQNTSPGMLLPIATKPIKPAQAASALEKQDQLLAGLLLGSPEFQRR